ncbi:MULTISPECIES: hypothetical protein [Saccharothrix]|uniref:hypothetical protein n=1 Tax=Saccharothrix TaxID=2071 RepID=UPI001161308E|nr:hypothetical protein [Saccharothrix sp. CB00851]
MDDEHVVVCCGDQQGLSVGADPAVVQKVGRQQKSSALADGELAVGGGTEQEIVAPKRAYKGFPGVPLQVAEGLPTGQSPAMVHRGQCEV